MELTFKDTLMFFQTALRNVGLYTSISLALLGYSRFYRGKGNALYNVSFIIISMIMLFLAISILQNLKENILIFKDKLDENEQQVVDNWLLISEYLTFTLFTISAFSLYTLYRQAFVINSR